MNGPMIPVPVRRVLTPRDPGKSLVGAGTRITKRQMDAFAQLFRLGEDNLSQLKYFQQCKQAWDERGEPCIIDEERYVWEYNKHKVINGFKEYVDEGLPVRLHGMPAFIHEIVLPLE